MKRKASLITIASYRDPWEAHLAKGRLEAEGILSFIQYEHHVRMYWPMSFALRGVRVQVPSAHVELAFKVIHSVTSGAYKALLKSDLDASLGEICPSCGSRNIKHRMPWDLIVVLFILFFIANAIFPIRREQHECKGCKHKWRY
jgi:hypothetical protein